MKNTRNLILTLIAGASVALLLSRTAAQQAQPAAAPAPAAAPTRVAICDMSIIIPHSQWRLDMKRQERARGESLAAQEKEKKTKILDAEKALRETVTPDTKDYNAEVVRIQHMVVNMKAWAAMADWDYKRWKLQEMSRLYQKIVELIGKVAEERKIDIVLHRRRKMVSADLRSLLSQINDRKVIYSGGNCIDLTDEVLKRLDAFHKASGRKAG